MKTCEIAGPHALVTAEASLHWMSWEPVMARLAGAIADHAFLAVVEYGPRDISWREDLLKVIVRVAWGCRRVPGTLPLAGSAGTGR